MSAIDDFDGHFAACPLVAILRGVTPDVAEDVGGVLVDSGLRLIEVPLNSPEPFRSIEILARRFGDGATIGAGTVLEVADVMRVREAGGRLIVSPDTRSEVIAATAAADMVSAPGYFTPSEAFAALRAGAHVLKLFPAEGASPALLKAQKAVLPKHVPIVIVGGIRSDNMQPWLDAGAAGFGLGSNLYKPGTSPFEVAKSARAFTDALRR